MSRYPCAVDGQEWRLGKWGRCLIRGKATHFHTNPRGKRMRLSTLCLLLVLNVASSNRQPASLRLDVVRVRTARTTHRDQPDQSHNLAGFDYLIIPKSMSTMTLFVLCDLVLRQRGLDKMRTMFGKGKIRCLENDWYSDHRVGKLLWKPRTHRPTILLLREPVERFVSMYSFLCKIRKLCGPRTNIHVFARRVYTILRHNKMIPGFKEGHAVFRHIQPSFWYAYNASRGLPTNPLIIYTSLDRNKNADQLRRAFIKGNVPPRIASEAVEVVRASFGNTFRTTAGQRDAKRYRRWTRMVYVRKQTLLHVLAAYYNDYRLLKIALPDELLKAIKWHGITLPDPIRDHHGRKIIEDRCANVRRHRTDDGRRIPLHPC